MLLNIGDKLFGLERRLYAFENQIPHVFVVHSVTLKLAHIKPFDLNGNSQSSKYSVYRTLFPQESRFLANWRGQPHPAFQSSFDNLWFWDDVCKTQYLQSLLSLKIKGFLKALSRQLDSLSFDDLQQSLQTFTILNQLSDSFNCLSLSDSNNLVFSDSELSLLGLQSLNQLQEAFHV